MGISELVRFCPDCKKELVYKRRDAFVHAEKKGTRCKSCMDGPYKRVWKNDIGKTFGRVTVLERVANGHQGHVRYKCKCRCGTVWEAWASAVRSGKTTSCGCYRTPIKREKNAPLRKIFNSYRGGAKKRDFKFDITIDQFEKLIYQNCTYCGDPPNRRQYAYHRTRYSSGVESDEFITINGVDRMDSSLGYTLDNCTPCCWKCNTIKMSMTDTEFKKQILKIYNHLDLCQITMQP